MTLQALPSAFETLCVLVFFLGLILIPLAGQALANATIAGVERRLTRAHKHGRIGA